MRNKTLLVSALTVFSVLGCGDAAPDGGDPSLAIVTPPADYVTQINTLCVRLVEDYLDVTKPHPGSFPIAEYLADKEKVQPLIDAFDAQVDAIPVSAADAPAAEAFAAFRRASDAADSGLAAAAATGDQEVFDAAIAERHHALEVSPERNELSAVGITCDAR